jgi:hypothetical protein
MTINFMNRMALALLRNRGVLTAACFSCVSLFLVVNAAPLHAQGDGSATMRPVPTFIGYEETYQWSDVPEILSEGAKDAQSDVSEYSWASDLLFQREIWQLQFKYKNVRTIDVNFPTKDGTFQTKRVWYMVYSVTNTGERLSAELVKDLSELDSVYDASFESKPDVSVASGKYQIPSNNLEGVHKPNKFTRAADDPEGAVLFVPRFVFASSSIQDRLIYERKEDGLFYGQSRGTEEGVYYDEYLPLAVVQISKRETRGNQELIDSVRMANRPIKPGETVWGVATWTDVDRRIDKFSVYISGLTNALRWEFSDEPDTTQVGAGREVMRKVLKLNFFSPGDEYSREGKEIYNNLPGELDFQWVYL